MSRAKKTLRKTSRKAPAKKPTPPKPKAPAAPDKPTPEQVVGAVRQMRAIPHETLVAVVQLLESATHNAPHNIVAGIVGQCRKANTVGQIADLNALAIEAKPGS